MVIRVFRLNWYIVDVALNKFESQKRPLSGSKSTSSKREFDETGLSNFVRQTFDSLVSQKYLKSISIET